MKNTPYTLLTRTHNWLPPLILSSYLMATLALGPTHAQGQDDPSGYESPARRETWADPDYAGSVWQHAYDLALQDDEVQDDTGLDELASVDSMPASSPMDEVPQAATLPASPEPTSPMPADDEPTPQAPAAPTSANAALEVAPSSPPVPTEAAAPDPISTQDPEPADDAEALNDLENLEEAEILLEDLEMPAESPLASAVALPAPLPMATSQAAQDPSLPQATAPAPQTSPEALPQAAAAPLEDIQVFQGIQVASAQPKTEETFSIDFNEEEARAILRSIADLYRLNVVIPETLRGMVSIKLHDVTWQEAFRSVLEPLGFAYIQDGKIIKIKSRAEIETEPMETRVFALQFSSAADMAAALSPLVDAKNGGRVLADKRTNVVMVTERPTRMPQLQGVIERLDAAESQIMIETKIAEIVSTDDDKLGFDWSSFSSLAGTLGNPQQTISGTQVDPGIRYTYIPERAKANVTNNDSIIFSASQLKVILKALQQNQNTQVVSSPSVVTMNNTPAQIHITNRYPIPNYSYNEQQGRFEVNGFNYEDIGVKLEVTPKAQQNLITLDIRPEVSSQGDAVTFGQGGAAASNIPQIKSRRTHSIVTLESGYTLAMSGLMSSDIASTHNRLPILGHMPLVGRMLFSSKEDKRIKTNIIIFVTATKIGFNGEPITPSQGNIPHNIDPRQVYQMNLTERDMPGYNLPADEKVLLEQVQTLRKQNVTQQQQQQVQKALNREKVLQQKAQGEVLNKS
jgi:type IV pilus assembly protein PilQ